MKNGASKRSRAKTGNRSVVSMAAVSGAMPMPANKGATARLITSDWRFNTNWQVWAMLAKIPGVEYAATVTAFEAHHSAAGTLSGDWIREWRAWCRSELMRRAALNGTIISTVTAMSEPDFEAMFG